MNYLYKNFYENDLTSLTGIVLHISSLNITFLIKPKSYTMLIQFFFHRSRPKFMEEDVRDVTPCKTHCGVDELAAVARKVALQTHNNNNNDAWEKMREHSREQVAVCERSGRSNVSDTR